MAIYTGPHFMVAIAAVHRPIDTRFMGYFDILAAPGACGGKNVTWRAVAAVYVTSRLPCLAARGAALGLVGKAFGGEKLLLLNAEIESCPASGAVKRLVLKIHRMTYSLLF
jgi:hypothetical protein